MLQTITSLLPDDPDIPARARRLNLLRTVLDGTLYDALPNEFHEERTPAGEYIPLRLRRPSVRYALARTVVEDSVALLFSEAHFPTFLTPDPGTTAALATLAADTNLNQVMIEAALAGSIGSAAIQLRILEGRVYLETLDTTWLTPVFDPSAPGTLLRVRERYKVPAATLASLGYDLPTPATTWWFTRDWDGADETWYLPQPLGAKTPPEPDPARSIRHGLGFVPIAWIRNLPGGIAPDGACTFRAAIETGIEIDYQLSQAGRGLKYSSDPTLLIKEPAGIDGELLRGAGNALIVSEKGDARLLEIGGTAASAVLDYVRVLRELALESIHGNRADASRLSAPASGRSLELMNQGLTWLADNLRISYGNALVQLARMMLRASTSYALVAGLKPLDPVDPAAAVSLVWPAWTAPTAADRAQDAQTLATLVQAGLLSRATATRVLAVAYDIADPEDERTRIAAEGPP